jgi:BirA family biotin operon repressor/biotin-[acetyl-CoA-carboxylase] ligase
VSAGFRPLDLRPADAWRVGAIAALAMLEAVEAMQGTATAGLGLKWPNDIVARRGRHVAKLGGVLGEGVVEGDRLVAVVVGIGVNAEWPAHEFPAHLAAAMTSVREVTGGPVDREALLAVWLDRLRRAYAELRIGGFPAVRWAGRQVTTGADVEVDIGTERLAGRALGVDAVSGGLTVRLPDASVRTIGHGEVVRCRLDGMGWDRQRLDWGIA